MKAWSALHEPAAPSLPLPQRRVRWATAIGTGWVVVVLSLWAWQRWLAPPWGEMTALPPASCNLQFGSCRAEFPDGSALEVTLAPRPVPSDTPITLHLRTVGFEPRSVGIDLNGETMNMGPNHTALVGGRDGVWTGATALTACVTGAMVWVLEVRAPVGGGERVARFRFETGEP